MLKKFTKKNSAAPESSEDSPFVSLTPVKNANLEKSYSSALSYALGTSDVHNIALSGPYGSGKSSILKSFEHQNKEFNFLYISLAAFSEENEEKEKNGETADKGRSGADKSVSEIQTSIVRQLIYGREARELKRSRFKKISSTSRPLLTAIFFTSWIFSFFFVFGNKKLILNQSYFWPNSGLNLGMLAIFAFGLIAIIRWFAIKYPNLTLKKISLAGEIETTDNSSENIFDKHLDEILYFFQVTKGKYTAVIFEDLDRFENPEIFVELRELNALLNANPDTGVCKFIYALKDDMFAEHNRTKFFDFIIPVVPVVNSSNSYDKLKERLAKHKFKGEIKERFLREVSLYLSDLRLIQNIMNEWEIYYSQLKSDGLDVTKLLAIIIYKNVYPVDFEKLHHESGVFYKLCNKKSELQEELAAQNRSEIAEIELTLRAIEKEQLFDLTELCSVYLMNIIREFPPQSPVDGIMVQGTHYSYKELEDFEAFEKLIQEPVIIGNWYQTNRKTTIKSTFKEIEKGVSSKLSFLERKQQIEGKNKSGILKRKARIRTLENENVNISNCSISEIFKKSNGKLDDLINSIGNPALFNYLIRFGHLDENYRIYTSNFYEVGKTQNDIDFILTVHGGRPAHALHKIDNPKEVIEYLRPQNFAQNYVLNVDLLDCLVNEETGYTKYRELALQYLTENLEACGEFLGHFLKNSKNLSEFTNAINQQSPDFLRKIIEQENGGVWAVQTLINVETEFLINERNEGNFFTNYLSANGDQVFTGLDREIVDYSVLRKLSVKFSDLTLISSNSELAQYAIGSELYELTPQNISFVCKERKLLHIADLSTSNYSTIRAAHVDLDDLIDYIHANINSYVEDVLLALSDNSKEADSALIELLKFDSLRVDLGEKLIEQKESQFKKLVSIPEKYWEFILQNRKVKPSWEGLSAYISSSIYNEEYLIELLQNVDICNELSNLEISSAALSASDKEKLVSTIIALESISDDCYGLLIQRIDKIVDKIPPDLSYKKLDLLLSHDKIALNSDTFAVIKENSDYLAVLINNNLDVFVSNQKEYEISDTVRGALIQSNIGSDYKFEILKTLDLAHIEQRPKLAVDIGKVYIAEHANANEVEKGILKLAIEHDKLIQNRVKLLTKYERLFTDAEILGFVSIFPTKFQSIAKLSKKPRIPRNAVNEEFVSMLKSRDVISSFKPLSHSIQVNTKRSR